MHPKSAVKCSFAALLLLALGADVVWAQATAQISGTARDQEGGVLPGVEVTVTHVETGLTRTTITNEAGVYALPNLPLGTHRLEASLPGFRTYVQSGIVLQVNSSPVINPVLSLGEISEIVEVTASAAMVETRAVGVGQVIENERILALPLDSRNVADLIVLSGQAVQTGTTGAGSRAVRNGDPALSIGGGLRGGTAYLLDGATYKNLFDANPLPYPFPDAVQEFKVETSGLSAEHVSGASVSAVTKSGTNQFHGTLFEFARNDVFAARSYFARTNSTLKRHQFGGTLGGPLTLNRLFFFGGYQGTRLRQDPADRRARIVTPAMLAGDWTTVASPACNPGRQINLRAPFVNNRIDPAQLSGPAVEIARRLLAESDVRDECGEVVFGRRNIEDENQAVGRIDYQMSDNHSLFGRAMLIFYEAPRPSTFNNPLLNANAAGADTSSQGYAVGSNYIRSANAVNSLRFSVNLPHIIRRTYGAFDPSEIGINAVAHTKGYTLALVSGAFNIGAAHLSADSVFSGRNITIEDNFTFIRGRHQLGIGGSLMHARSHRVGATSAAPTFTFTAQATGLSLADFMLGRPSSMVQGSPADLVQTQWFPALFAQDAWQVTPRVTLSLGLRWEPDLPVAMEEGYIVNFDLDRFRQGTRSTVFTNAPAGLYYPGDPGFPGKSGVHKTWARFAPRAGAAWDVQGDGRMSLRASYGLGYDQQPLGFYGGAFVASPFFNRLTLVNPDGGLADPWRGVPGGQPFPLQITSNAQFVPYGDYLSMPYDRANPRNSSWNVTIQRQIAAEWLAMASYIGTYATHLWGIKMLNPGVYFFNGTSTCTLPNGQTIAGSGNQCSTTANTNQRRRFSLERPEDGQLLGRVSEFDTNGTQRYHGLRLSLERRTARGVSVGGNYTWSHCLQDFTSDGQPNVEQAYPDPDNLAAERGNCEGSRRHVFNLTAVYETPDFANDTLRIIAGGWRVSGISRKATGTFLTVTSGQDRALTDIANQRPNRVRDDVVLDRSGGPNTQYLNPAAFALPALGTNGDMGRANVVGPGTWQLDMALSRILRLAATQGFELRAEAFNVTNSFRPGNPDTALRNATFGQIRTALEPRILQFAVKYFF